MRRKHIYFILLAFLAVSIVQKSRELFTYEKIVPSGGTGFWYDEWFSLISQEVNQKGIRLIIDGQEVTDRRQPVKMSEDGIFMLPVEILPEQFQCFARFYDSALVMERGLVYAKLKAGSLELSVGDELIPLTSGLMWEEDKLYVPLEAVEQALSYEREWNVEDSTLKLTYTGWDQQFLPSVYDYREKGRAPQVKNQGSLGTCWAFASLMALESRLLPAQDIDFSEDHMSLCNSFQMSQNDGGEYTMSMAYLLSWQGPVLEKDDRYGDGYSPPGLEPVFHVQDIQVLPEKDYEAIKRAVYLYGGVQSSLYTSMVTGQSSSRFYNKEKGAYYYSGTDKPNHDIVIIGWDDNYPKENFAVTPEEDGAFICANSWGGEFGEEGYFYVSYDDVNIGVHNILYSRVDEVDCYDQIYQTDLCGWVGQLGYGREDAYFANVYTSAEDEVLEAVGFYATGPDTDYEVYTVTNAENSAQFGRRKLQASGHLDYSGYYTIELEEPLDLPAGERFAVIVNIKTPDAIHPIAIEYSSPDKALKVDLSDGEGYVSFRGTSWERVEEAQNCNVCLKAYTRKRDT